MPGSAGIQSVLEVFVEQVLAFPMYAKHRCHSFTNLLTLHETVFTALQSPNSDALQDKIYQVDKIVRF